MKRIKVFAALVAIFCCYPLQRSFALMVETHQAINEYIAQRTLNGFSLNDHLRNQLGFQNGSKERFIFGESKMVFEWLGRGGVTEDKPTDGTIPYFRSTNHFHDPLSNEGFGGLLFGLLFNGDSSIIWSQKPFGTQTPGGRYSWFDSRDYFYEALTATYKVDRDRYFAETFRGIGQLMHLVEDSSVPAHTRNQFHVGYDYEGFVLKYQNEAILNSEGKFEALLANPISFDKTMLDIPGILAPLPFANIIDIEQYTTANPDPTVTLTNRIGLAEYTNANFFSDFTIFKTYPHPAKENTNAVLREQQAEDGETDHPYYIQGYQSERLAAYSYFTNLQNITGVPEGWKYNLDDGVYEDYAQKLIPRAVGYSAGLLDYFFRGKINIMQTGRYTFQIVNLSDEDLSGDLTAFKLFYDDTTNNRHEIPLGYSDPSGSVSALAIPARSISTFTATMGAIPVNPKEPGTYTLVFQGRLGNEEGAVIGQAITPHFLAHVNVGGQWDIYEYDLLGNRIINVTGSLPRGTSYYGGSPSPANPDLIQFYADGADSGCAEGWSCLHLITKSTAQPVNLGKFGVFWWSKDGAKIHAQDTYYDLLSDTWQNQPMSRCDYQVADSSFSSNGTRLASEVRAYDTVTQDYTRYDIAILDNWAITGIVDMNTMSVVPVDGDTCQNYRTDEEYFDAEPDYHPYAAKVAFSSNRHGTFDASYADRIPYNIYMAEGSSVTKLTDAAAGVLGFYEAAWSPDGNKLILAGKGQNDVSNIYIMPAILESGEVPTPVTTGGEDHYLPRWMGYLGQ